MFKIISILLVFVSTISFSQNEMTEIPFRQLTGNLIDVSGAPFPGQNVMIKGTNIGTQTDFDGNFCLTIPKNTTVFIELPFCFDQILREIKPNDNNIRLQLEKQKRKTRKATRKYNKVKSRLDALLFIIYNSSNYKATGDICNKT